MICCGMSVKRMEYWGGGEREMKALTEGGDSDTDW